MTCSFTFDHYREILEAARGTDIEIVHDVDFPPNNVEPLARIEFEVGVRTKYFVRLHAKFYNALSLEHVELFKRVSAEYGHEIGLHFEPSFYQPTEVSAGIALEHRMLESAYGTSIQTLSIHCPAKGGTITEDNVPNGLRLYCFDSQYYRGKKYISDSGGRWREGCACNHIGKHEKLIVLTHPNWWYASNPSENF